MGVSVGGLAIYWFSKVGSTIHNLKLCQYHTLLALTFPCIVCFCTCWIYFCCLAPFLFFNPKVLSLKWKCISCISSLIYMISNRSGTVPPKIYFYLIKFYYFGSVSNLMLLLLFSSQNSLSILLFDKKYF